MKLIKLVIEDMQKNYRYFLMVAHLGSIKQAAEQLYISQPSLTSAMKKLESDIGVSLFQRRSKGMELTAYGQLLRDHVQQQQEQHSQLLYRLHDMQQRESGKLKLGTGDTWWELFVRDAVNQYLTMSPTASIDLEFGNNLSLMHHLVQGEIDLFVGHEVHHLHERCKVTFLPLLQDREAIYVRHGHPLLKDKNRPVANSLDVEYPMIKVTADHSRHSSVLADHVTSQFNVMSVQDIGRTIYNVDSFAASLDILRSTNAIMPYSSEIASWMNEHGFSILRINQHKVGNVGVYFNQVAEDKKITAMVDLLNKKVRQAH